MYFKRENIVDMSPASIKKLNDMFRGIMLVLTGNVDGGNIRDNSIDSSKIKELTADKITAGTIDAAVVNIENLTVGENVAMGDGAVISWNNLPSDVASESQIPSTAGLIDATTATFISQSVVSTSTIACDQLTTPEGHEAVIRLFGTDMEAMLDARESAIRLQWSPYDYIYVSDTMVSFYIDGNEIFRVTPAQILYNNSPLATSSNVVPVFG